MVGSCSAGGCKNSWNKERNTQFYRKNVFSLHVFKWS